MVVLIAQLLSKWRYIVIAALVAAFTAIVFSIGYDDGSADVEAHYKPIVAQYELDNKKLEVDVLQKQALLDKLVSESEVMKANLKASQDNLKRIKAKAAKRSETVKALPRVSCEDAISKLQELKDD